MGKTHSLTITAELTETIGASKEPAYVRIRNAGFLAPSALADIAQEVLDSYYAIRHPYLVTLPDRELIDDDMYIKVIVRKV